MTILINKVVKRVFKSFLIIVLNVLNLIGVEWIKEVKWVKVIGLLLLVVMIVVYYECEDINNEWVVNPIGKIARKLWKIIKIILIDFI